MASVLTDVLSSCCSCEVLTEGALGLPPTHFPGKKWSWEGYCLACWVPSGPLQRLLSKCICYVCLGSFKCATQMLGIMVLTSVICCLEMVSSDHLPDMLPASLQVLEVKREGSGLTSQILIMPAKYYHQPGDRIRKDRKGSVML